MKKRFKIGDKVILFYKHQFRNLIRTVEDVSSKGLFVRCSGCSCDSCGAEDYPSDPHHFSWVKKAPKHLLLNFTKNLDISTCHVRKKDLSVCNRDIFVHYDLNGEGMLFLVGSLKVSELKSLKYSTEFINIVKLAIKSKCDYIKFDRDGTVYDFLPKFYW
jgi:hypothetical protein